MRLSEQTLPDNGSDIYFLVYPNAVQHWPPLQALRRWLLDELENARLDLDAARR